VELAVDDADHEDWRAEIDGLIGAWRSVIDLREDDGDEDVDLDDREDELAG
jgi:hypothetical protein